VDIKSSFPQEVRSLPKGHNPETGEPRGQAVSDLAQARNAERKGLNEPDKVSGSAESIVKKQLNAQILASAVNVSVSAGDQPMGLVLKAALEGVNEALKEAMGDNAIQNSYEAGVDVSPEATAGRIVSLSTAFFGAYQAQNPEMGEEEALSSFMGIIGGGIDKGFKEARDILGGLDVLEGDIATNIDKTYALVQDGLKSFAENYGSSANTESTEVTES